MSARPNLESPFTVISWARENQSFRACPGQIIPESRWFDEGNVDRARRVNSAVATTLLMIDAMPRPQLSLYWLPGFEGLTANKVYLP